MVTAACSKTTTSSRLDTGRTNPDTLRMSHPKRIAAVAAAAAIAETPKRRKRSQSPSGVQVCTAWLQSATRVQDKRPATGGIRTRNDCRYCGCRTVDRKTECPACHGLAARFRVAPGSPVRVARSRIYDGRNGVFVRSEGAKAGQRLTSYCGPHTKTRPTGAYVFKLTEKRYIDGDPMYHSPSDGIASMCNTKGKTDATHNCELVANLITGAVTLVATKDIAPYQECYCPYGTQYGRLSGGE